MDTDNPGLDAIFDVATRRLPAEGVACLLVGGFAVNYHGYTRNTLDVDFMILADRADTVRRVMTEAGFVNVIVEANVTHYQARDGVLRADFLNVDGETLDRLLTGAVVADVRGYRLKIPALMDLLAMKIFALSRDPARRAGKDLPDIATLSVLHDLDPETDLRPLCARFGTPEVYETIAGQTAALRTP